MGLTCEGKSLGGFQLGVMKSSFFLKKKKQKTHFLLCGAWIVVKPKGCRGIRQRGKKC